MRNLLLSWARNVRCAPHETGACFCAFATTVLPLLALAMNPVVTHNEVAHHIDPYAPYSVWQVTATAKTNAHMITVYQYINSPKLIDWGDGHVSAGSDYVYKADSSSVKDIVYGHTYNPGVYTVKLSGKVASFAANGYYVTKVTSTVGGKTYTLYPTTFVNGKIVSRVVRWGDNITKAENTFSNASIQGQLPKWGKNMTYVSGCFMNAGCYSSTIPKWPKNVTHADQVFQACQGLSGTIPEWPESCQTAQLAYFDCKGLTGDIPAWPKTMWRVYKTYYGCSGLTGAWTDDPDKLMPTNITDYSDCVTDSSSELRAYFYSDWGGVRMKDTSVVTNLQTIQEEE